MKYNPTFSKILLKSLYHSETEFLIKKCEYNIFNITFNPHYMIKIISFLN